MTGRLGFVAVGLAACALAAGCGDDDNDTASTSTPEPAMTTGGTEGAAVGMKNLEFDPKDITVSVGETITWTNNESIDHDVVANEGADFKSDTFGEGGTYEYTPTEAGKISYECTLHPGMEGTINVQ